MHGQAACHQTPTGARAWAREGLVDRLCAAAPHLFHRDGVLGGRRCQRGGEAHGQDSAGGEHDRSVTHGTANRRRGWVSGGGGGKAAQAQDNGCKPEEGLGERRRRRRGGEAARRRTTGAVVQGPGSTWQHAQPHRGAHTQRMCHLPCAGNTAALGSAAGRGEAERRERCTQHKWRRRAQCTGGLQCGWERQTRRAVGQRPHCPRRQVSRRAAVRVGVGPATCTGLHKELPRHEPQTTYILRFQVDKTVTLPGHGRKATGARCAGGTCGDGEGSACLAVARAQVCVCACAGAPGLHWSG